jgi:checkpoint serine/threonine-protein kinase
MPPSPTINTKAALAEVNDMFAKTLRFDRSPGGDDRDTESDNEEEDAGFDGIIPDTQQGDDTFWGTSQASTAPTSQGAWPPASQGSQSQNNDQRTLADEDDEDDEPSPEDSILVAKSVAPSPPPVVQGDNTKLPRPASAPFKPSRPAAPALSKHGDENAGSRLPVRSKAADNGRPRLILGAKPMAVKRADDDEEEVAGSVADREVSVKDPDEEEEDRVGKEDDEEEQSVVTPTNVDDGFAMGRRAGGNRFANLIDAMTPITERTCEYTTFSRASSVRPSVMAADLEEDEEEEGETDFDHAFVVEDLASSRGSQTTSRSRDNLNLARIVDEERPSSRRSSPGGGDSRIVVLNDISERSSSIAEDGGETPNKSFRSFNHSNASFQLPEGYSITANQTEATASMVLIDKTSTLGWNEGSSREGSPGPSVASSEATGRGEPCNPFATGVINRILAAAQPRVEDQGNFRDLRGTESNRLPELNKIVKRNARRSTGSASGGRTSTSPDDRSLDLDLGGDAFKVRDRLGEGGFATVFHVTDLADLDDEDSVPDRALKVEHPANMWEFHVLCHLHARLSEDIRRSIISPRRHYVYKDESFLELDYCDAGTLLTGKSRVGATLESNLLMRACVPFLAVNRAPDAGISPMVAGGNVGLEELLAMFFMIELLRVIEALHSSGIIHGDVKPENCLVRLEDVPGGNKCWSAAYKRDGSEGWSYKGVKLIDFGRSIDVTAFRPGQEFVGDWPTEVHDCVEMREGRPWSYQPDYFGLAAVAHVLLFGKFIEVAGSGSEEDGGDPTKKRYSINQPFKRYHQAELWGRLFDTLLNPRFVRPDGALPITPELGAIRAEMETWLEANCDKNGKSLKALLKKLEIAATQQ